jgi:hypothetical protein
LKGKIVLRSRSPMEELPTSPFPKQKAKNQNQNLKQLLEKYKQLMSMAILTKATFVSA